MRIAHVSDLHGHYNVLDGIPDDADLVVSTGDFFPNKTRGHVPTEQEHQTRWFGFKAESIVSRLKGKPVLLVPGNHDYVDLARYLRREGVLAHEVTPQGHSFRGVQFAGFGHIPFIAGEWNREVLPAVLRDLVEETMTEGNPEVLLTHAPASGILDGNFEGNTPLATHLAYKPHRVKLHLFGHAHEDGGKNVERMGVRFYNSATRIQVIDL